MANKRREGVERYASGRVKYPYDAAKQAAAQARYKRMKLEKQENPETYAFNPNLGRPTDPMSRRSMQRKSEAAVIEAHNLGYPLDDTISSHARTALRKFNTPGAQRYVIAEGASKPTGDENGSS